jgi:hypothetical protein
VVVDDWTAEAERTLGKRSVVSTRAEHDHHNQRS